MDAGSADDPGPRPDDDDSAAQPIAVLDPRSYLPVRLVTRLLAYQSNDKGLTTATLTTDFRWLPPTRANVNELTVPIPPGFSKVGYPVTVEPAKPRPKASVSG